jgi:8-oxo-dGTP pyrophosphatase MutT (NUDIX family)
VPPAPGRGTPVHDRGRFGRFSGGLVDYVRTAWWGAVAPRTVERRPLAIAQGVILRENAGRLEVLLSVRSDLFGWELPGGTVERGEAPSAALVREVQEETGLEISLEGPVGTWRRTGFRPHTAHVYRGRAVGGTLRPSHETPRVAWFDAAAPPAALFPWYREPLSVARERRPAAVAVDEVQGLPWILEAMRIDLRMRWEGLPAPAASPDADRASV